MVTPIDRDQLATVLGGAETGKWGVLVLAARQLVRMIRLAERPRITVRKGPKLQLTAPRVWESFPRQGSGPPKQPR